jgi:hypothetical protein
MINDEYVLRAFLEWALTKVFNNMDQKHLFDEILRTQVN